MKKINLETIVHFLAMLAFCKRAFDHRETFFFEGLLDIAFVMMVGYFLFKKIKN